MIKNYKLTSTILFFTIFMLIIPTYNQSPSVSGWSSAIATHGRVGVSAGEIMPEPWMTFFASNSVAISDAADYPDAHKDVDPVEFGRHYDDSDIPHDDHTSIGGSDDWALGVVSWAVENATRELTQLIKNDAADEDLIYQFGFVSHYAADATMPFHATSNYNGQFTGNTGVHSRLEEFIFQTYGDDIFANITLTEPKYIVDPYASTKVIIAAGLALVPDYLDADTLGIAAAEAVSSITGFTSTFYNLMNQSIIERISIAVQFTADLWYTAIVNAEPPTATSTNDTTSSTTNSDTTSTTVTGSTSSTTGSNSSTDDNAGQPTLGLTILVTLFAIIIKRKSSKP